MPQSYSFSNNLASVPTFTRCNFGGVSLEFWIHKDIENQKVQLMVRRATSANRLWHESERYAIATFNNEGKMYRNSGLPPGWGIKLTKEFRVKELP